MDFIEKFKSVLPEEVNFDDLYDLAPADLWKSDPRKAGALALERADCFDRNAYLEKYNDVSNKKIDAVEHYINNGIDEGRTPFFITNKHYGNVIKSTHKNINKIVYNNKLLMENKVLINKLKKEKEINYNLKALLGLKDEKKLY